MTEHFHASMDREIFKLGLSVEATSAYILVTSLVGENTRPSIEALQAKWTGSNQDLDQALAELTGRNVIQPRKGPEGEDLYYPNPSSLWR